MDTAGFNGADIVAFIIILIGTILGLKQGLSGLMTLLLTSVGIWFSVTKGFDPLHAWLLSHFSMPAENAVVAARVILVLLPVIAGALLYVIFRILLKATFTTWVDRIGGALAGGLTTAGLIFLAFILLGNVPNKKIQGLVGESSWIGREVVGSETQLVETLRGRVNKGENLILKAREERAGRREKWEE